MYLYILGRDLVQQMYLRNCALCVLSRLGVTDDILDPRGAEANTEFIDAAHLAGE